MKSYKLSGMAWSADTVIGIIMLVVICMVVVLNGPAFLGLGRQDKARSDTSSLAGLISQYEMEVGRYPNNLSDLTSTEGQYGPWLKEVPEDPYNHNQSYQYASQAGDGFVVFSVGEDGASSSDVANGIQGDDIGYRSR